MMQFKFTLIVRGLATIRYLPQASKYSMLRTPSPSRDSGIGFPRIADFPFMTSPGYLKG